MPPARFTSKSIPRASNVKSWPARPKSSPAPRPCSSKSPLVPLYADAIPAQALIAEMADIGFIPAALWPGFADAKGQILQIEIIFTREAPLASAATKV